MNFCLYVRNLTSSVSKLAFLAILSCSLNNPCFAKSTLIKAKIVGVRELSDEEKNNFYKNSASNLIKFDSVWDITFSQIEIIDGDGLKDVIDINRSSARPAVGGVYYILYDKSKKFSGIVWYQNISYGMCMDDETAIKYHVLKYMKSLRRKDPCNSR